MKEFLKPSLKKVGLAIVLFIIFEFVLKLFPGAKHCLGVKQCPEGTNHLYVPSGFLQKTDCAGTICVSSQSAFLFKILFIVIEFILPFVLLYVIACFIFKEKK